MKTKFSLWYPFFSTVVCVLIFSVRQPHLLIFQCFSNFGKPKDCLLQMADGLGIEEASLFISTRHTSQRLSKWSADHTVQGNVSSAVYMSLFVQERFLLQQDSRSKHRKLHGVQNTVSLGSNNYFLGLDHHLLYKDYPNSRASKVLFHTLPGYSLLLTLGLLHVI